MNNLFVCNGYSDNVSMVDINLFKRVGEISLKKEETDRIGPHGICIYNNKLLVANNYSNSLCLIDVENKIIEKDFFVGMNCNDVKVSNDNAYVVCGDLNNIVNYDLKENQITEEIPCGNMPHSIDIHEALESIVIANMNSDSITFFEYKDTNTINHIRVGEYPTKALFSDDGSLILVCESNIGSDKCGNISIVSSKDSRILHKIPVGNSPVDMFIEKNLCLVSNFGDGSISIIDLSRFIEVSRIDVGGMPRGIVKNKENIYIGDNYNDLLLCINFNTYTKKAIFIGKEPTAMLLF